MSDVVKWAALAALIAVLIATLLSTPFFDQITQGNNFLNSFDDYVIEFVNTLGSVFLYARKLINNFLPAELVTITLALRIARKPLYLLLELSSNAVKAIYK